MIVCIQHPRYNPQNPPDLCCKQCCKLYVNQVHENQRKIREEGANRFNKIMRLNNYNTKGEINETLTETKTR